MPAPGASPSPSAAGHPAWPASGTRHFGDAQEQASALVGWSQDYLQLSAGAFQGEIRQVQAPGVRLFAERLQQSVLQTGVLPGDVLALGIALHSDGDSMFCGTPCGPDTLHVFSGVAGFEFRAPRQHTMLAIELQLGSAAALYEGLAGTAEGGTAPCRAQAGARRLAPTAFSELRSYLLSLFGSALANPGVLAHAAVSASVADFLLDRVAQAGGGLAHAGRAGPYSHWKLVQRACKLVGDRADTAPTVAQLCLDLGVSRRTLQNGFQQVLGTSPLAYLKALRLRRARLALQRAASVTEAATACGFWHFGHFAQDYQAMFGERPSDTLRRHASPKAGPAGG